MEPLDSSLSLKLDGFSIQSQHSHGGTQMLSSEGSRNSIESNQNLMQLTIPPLRDDMSLMRDGGAYSILKEDCQPRSENYVPGVKQKSFAGYNLHSNRPVPGSLQTTSAPKQSQTKNSNGYTIEHDDYKRVLTAEDIECLASHLGNNWRKVAKLIGFSSGEIETLKTDHSKSQKEQIRTMLYEFKKKYGHKAQLKYVTKSLEYLVNHGIPELKSVVSKLGSDPAASS